MESMEESRRQVNRALASCRHKEQVEEGILPAVPPSGWTGTPEDWATFSIPQPLDDRGLPWWFGPDYKPTPEAIEEFEKPPSAE